MGILNFKEYSLNEKLGIADATLYYIDPVFNKVWEEFRNFHSSGESELEKDIRIGYRSFYNRITDKEIYSKFPVVGITLTLEFKKIPAEKFKKKYKVATKNKKKHSVGGWANRFGHKNWAGYSKIKEPIKQVTDHGIIVDLGIEIYASSDYNIGTYWKKLTDDIYETIWHELNHSYEYYNRVKGGQGPIWSRSPRLAVTYADCNKWNITKGIYDFWSNNFTYYLYASEPYELNAQVQEAGYFVSKYGIKSLYKTTAWKYADYMEKFNPDGFLFDLEEVILKKGKDIRTTKENLRKMWLNQYRKFLTDEKEEPTIDDKLVEKMNCDEFVNFMAKRLHKSGRYLKLKLGKLYGISPEANSPDKPDRIADYYKSKGFDKVVAKETGNDEEVH